VQNSDPTSLTPAQIVSEIELTKTDLTIMYRYGSDMCATSPETSLISHPPPQQRNCTRSFMKPTEYSVSESEAFFCLGKPAFALTITAIDGDESNGYWSQQTIRAPDTCRSPTATTGQEAASLRHSNRRSGSKKAVVGRLR